MARGTGQVEAGTITEYDVCQSDGYYCGGTGEILFDGSLDGHRFATLHCRINLHHPHPYPAISASCATRHAAILQTRARPTHHRAVAAAPSADVPVRSPCSCLPSWKWTDDVLEQLGRGSASDADADGILGMVLLTIAGERAAARPTWLEAVITETYRSVEAFMHYETQEHPRL